MNHSGNRWRHEYKYLIDAKQEEILKIRASGIMLRDPHVRADGAYTVRSLYLDDLEDSCFTDNLSGNDFRSKFRIRYYNDDIERIVLERKVKKSGLCMKYSCELSQQECYDIIHGISLRICEGMPMLKKSLFNEINIRKLWPKVIVTYERIPFVYSAGNVRITFDRNITSSYDIGEYMHCRYSERPVLPLGRCIMEVKWDEMIPLHIKDTFQMGELRWEALSKYYICRINHL